MPELPEVESMRRLLEPVMSGARFDQVILRRADLRDPFPSGFRRRLTGQTVVSLRRRAKYLLADLSSGEILLMHLGMSGWFRVGRDRERAERHDHVIFRMSSGAVVTFNDPRRFGLMNLITREQSANREHAIHALGPEPLSAEFDAAALARMCKGKKTSLKAALLDQHVVAGLGNIYVSEALHRAGLSPLRTASSIATSSGAPRPAARRLVVAIRRVLEDAIARVSTGGYRASRFRVYDRAGERCLRQGCKGVIKRRTQAGRSTFYCPVCQR